MPDFAAIGGDLPLFRAKRGGEAWFYTPGALTRARGEAERLARAADEAWRERHSGAFAPTCLTLYLSNRCGLACAYCYSAFDQGARAPERAFAANDKALPLLSHAAIAAAARLVAGHCAEREKAFSLVVHGGGEPSDAFGRLRTAVEITRQAAAARGVGWTSYVSTNGVMSPRQAEWLAHNFTRVGLSCDGPPNIHDAQRPTRSGRPTSTYVARTASVLAECGATIDVRATVTPAGVAHLGDIVAYAADALHARYVHVEPAYGAKVSWRRAHAPAFVDALWRARAIGQARGVEVALSGVRLDELHGPHCSLAKDVLSITPDGAATACFLTTDGRLPQFGRYVVGRYDSARDSYMLDEAHIARIIAAAGAIPAMCRNCVNVMHCARDCPDACVLSSEPISGGFRCETQRLATHRWLNELIGAEPALAS